MAHRGVGLSIVKDWEDLPENVFTQIWPNSCHVVGNPQMSREVLLGVISKGSPKR